MPTQVIDLGVCWTFHAVVSTASLLDLALIDGAGAPMPTPAILLAVCQAAVEGLPAAEVHAHVSEMARGLREELGWEMEAAGGSQPEK